MFIEVDAHKIRKFSINDKKLVVEFFQQMGGESRGFFNRGNGNENDALSYFDKNGNEPNKARFLSYITDSDGNEIMTGYIFAWDMDYYVPTLGIAVREEYKGHGLGKALIQYFTDYLKENKYGGVMLTTSLANIRGQSLYTKMGFFHIGMHTSGEMLFILNFKR